MRKILVLSLVLMMIFAGGLIVNAEERETVFRELAWGDSLEFLEEEYDMEFMRLKELEIDDIYNKSYGMEWYRRKNDDNQLGSHETSLTNYAFFQDELMMIILFFKDSVSKEGVIDMFIARYGEEDVKEEGFGEVTYKWLEEDTGIGLFYKKGVLTGNVKTFHVSFLDRTRRKKLKAWQKEQQEKQAEEQAEDW